MEHDHTALLLIDMQNDFCSAGGTFATSGYDVSMYAAMIPGVQCLLKAARQAGVLRIFIQNTTLANHLSDSPAQVRFRVRLAHDPDAPSLRYTEDESWGHQFVAALTPEPGEPVLKKYRSSAFVGTPLDLLLRSNGIDTIVICGCTTEGCVESTARDGMFLDYYVVVVPDCIESDTREQHEASLTLMRNRFDMFPSAEIVATWPSLGGDGSMRQ
ncbi:MAG: cysteine hydrolase [Candidatus Dormibacteraeota bacterium]|uniref:Cysteine hydrolase n=1 Tax=Candidatus Aeolococcus gillhamiae TaxID=3127015 RepID=A0A934JRN9_9BACT|nr:cysteine hydrolase [Candidatus Dormibacteraeota bacterium]